MVECGVAIERWRCQVVDVGGLQRKINIARQLLREAHHSWSANRSRRSRHAAARLRIAQILAHNLASRDPHLGPLDGFSFRLACSLFQN